MKFVWVLALIIPMIFFQDSHVFVIAKENDALQEQLNYKNEPKDVQELLKADAKKIGFSVAERIKPVSKPLRALILFDLDEKGNVSDLRAMRIRNGLKSIVSLPELEFELIEKRLIEALRKSSPLSSGKKLDTCLLVYDPSQSADHGVFLDAVFAGQLPEVLSRFDCDSPWVEPSKALTYIKSGSGNKRAKISFPHKGLYQKWREALCYYQCGRHYMVQGETKNAQKNLEKAISIYPNDPLFRNELKTTLRQGAKLPHQ